MLAAVFLSHIPISCSSSNTNRNVPQISKSKRPLNRNAQFPDSKDSNPSASQSNAPVKMPTPPWMNGPLLLLPHQLLNPLKPTNKNSSKNANVQRANKALFGKESGVRGKKAMKKIIRNVENLPKLHLSEDSQKIRAEELEVVDWLEHIGGGDSGEVEFGGKMPWSREEDRVVFRRAKKEKVVTAAETRLDKYLLRRLRGEAARMSKWVKVKKAGVTPAVVDEIRLAWRSDELAMVKFDVPLCRNMDRAREILEMKTGGLVVWSKKDAHVIYRGSSLQFSPKSFLPQTILSNGGQVTPPSSFSYPSPRKDFNYYQVTFNQSSECASLGRKEGWYEPSPTDVCVKDGSHQLMSWSLYERETDRLLDGLGPRYIDWWMRKPLPVDADLLPEVVPGFRPPVRLGPPNTKVKLTDDELTYLRKLAHPLPFHFVLGRNRKLQGLAVAILKLWEKSVVAKIAIKWGVLNTNNAQMAYELKRLTGGVLLLRNKFLIILYRGKDFLPCSVAILVAERENAIKGCQLDEEGARMKATETFHIADKPLMETRSAGTLSEFRNIQAKFGDLATRINESELQLKAKKRKLEKELRKQELKLSILNIKIEKSAKELAELNSALQPAEQDMDQEIITEEERACLRKIGLKLNSLLVLGRRGVFDGVIEAIHQHWKHREVVKALTMQKSFSQVFYTAKMLETESGGILVSVEKLKEGHAIIIYRGKNYRRPLKLMTDNLLNKREALHRSLEMQRLGSLKFFAYQRRQNISDLKHQLAELQDGRDGTSTIKVTLGRVEDLQQSLTISTTKCQFSCEETKWLTGCKMRI